MAEETLFRLILAVLSATLVINHHVIHRRPRSTSKRSAKGIELWLLAPLCIWTLFLTLYVLGAGFPALKAIEYPLSLPSWMRWLGVVLLALCVPISHWIYHELGVHFSKKLELRNDHQLITTGPYRYVRHPMYATLYLCAIAVGMISADLPVIISAVWVALAFIVRMKNEEFLLTSRFGESYRQYAHRTGALVPKL